MRVFTTLPQEDLRKVGPAARAIEADGYDGVAITGSALNVYDGGPAIERQIELARAVMASRTPLFGSCWGLQLITVAAGGAVRANPKGREIGIGRRRHPALRGGPGSHRRLAVDVRIDAGMTPARHPPRASTPSA